MYDFRAHNTITTGVWSVLWNWAASKLRGFWLANTALPSFITFAENPSWIVIFNSSYTDYVEPARLSPRGKSILVFSTVRVGMFAFFMRKDLVDRCLLVFMKPVDISTNDSVILSVYICRPAEKEVRNRSSRPNHKKCDKIIVEYVCVFEYYRNTDEMGSLEGKGLILRDMENENNIRYDSNYQSMRYGSRSLPLSYLTCCVDD